MTKYLGIIFAFIFLVGCESRFAGKRGFNLTKLNGPYKMHLVSIAGTDYFGVINTNGDSLQDDGSLHFYSIGTATSPELNTNLSVRIPTGVGDFAVDNDVLYLADRSENRILIYDLSGGQFVLRTLADGDPDAIKVSSNPQRLLVFDRTDSVRVLAVVCQISGMIHFIRLDTLAFISEGLETPAARDTLTINRIVGADLYMEPRREQAAPRDDRINVSGSVRDGGGINNIVLLPSVGTEQIFVVANVLANALFGYRFESLTNTSNIVWDLKSAREITDDEGFRGLAVDQSGNVFTTSQPDNSIYKIPRSEFDRQKESDTSTGRNTRGFPENATDYHLIDIDSAAEVFPRVGDIVTDCPVKVDHISVTCGGAIATRAWTLGWGTKKVYRVDLSGTPALNSSDALDGIPRELLWHPTANILYISVPNTNKIVIKDADSLATVGQLENP